MALLNIDVAKLSAAQTWAMVMIAGAVLGVSVFRENKAVTNIQDTRDVAIQNQVKIERLQNDVEQNAGKAEKHATEHKEIVDGISSDIEILKSRQNQTDKNISEIVNIGRDYLKKQDIADKEELEKTLDDWLLKKSGERDHDIFFQPLEDD
jgi:hypothetical protein